MIAFSIESKTELSEIGQKRPESILLQSAGEQDFYLSAAPCFVSIICSSTAHYNQYWHYDQLLLL